MSLPEIVQSAVGDEPVAARVSLGGEDELFVTPTRTLIYRSEGLLSDESVEEYGHGAERVEVSEGRRKSRVTLDYGLDGEKTFAVPTGRLQDALHPVLAGVFNAADITDAGETVKRTFRFSELTIVVTSARLVKHIGTPVWDEDFEEYHFEDVTDLTFEEGNVATSVVLTLQDRQERFKAPNEQARQVRETLTDALLNYHDVGSLEELRVRSQADQEEPEEPTDNVSFGDGPDPLTADPTDLGDAPANATREEETEPPGESGETVDESPADAGAVAETVREPATDAGDAEGVEASDVETAGPDDVDLAAELAALRETVEAQNEQLQRQSDLIDQLIEELRQGR